ncbi:MAG: hypothetical protein ABSD29_21330 [Verrucomicrobiota bacterium]|jgi:hypothetical protein
MKVVNNLGRFGWPIAVGMAILVLSEAASMLLAACFGGWTPDAKMVGYYPPFPCDNATPFWGSVWVYYMCGALFYLALAGGAVALVCMLLPSSRNRQ